MITTPLSALLLVSGAAVAAAGAGAWIGARRPVEAPAAVGWASALAAGVMLGAGYALMAPAVEHADVPATVGAALGVIASYLLRQRASPADVPRAALRGTALHAAAEGVALGAALAVGGAFGLALAWTIAAHNAAEGLALGALLARADGRTAGRAAAAATLARTSQVALAAATALLLAFHPALLPWALGFGFGALFYLVVAELLPTAYAVAGRTGIAIVVTLAAGLVALVGGRAFDGAAWTASIAGIAGVAGVLGAG